MANYEIIVKAIVDTAGIQAQLKSAAANQTISIKANVSTTAAQGEMGLLNNKVLDFRNKLSSLSTLHSDAFKTVGIQNQAKEMDALVGAFQRGGTGLKDVDNKMKTFEQNVKSVDKAITSATSSTDNFATTLRKDIVKVAEWLVATTLIMGLIQQVREATEYISDLNKEMTNIGMVTGQTTEELSGMANEFNDMAKDLGVDTLAIAQGATTWIRAGKSVAETQELLRNSTMLSKLGNLEAADATDKLIAVTNAYNISAKDSIEVINVLVSLDNAFATSTGEISAAMQKSSSMAKLAGVSYRDLASYITIVSSITRQSGDTIGQAFSR